MNHHAIAVGQGVNQDAYKIALQLYYLNKCQQPKKVPRLPANDYRRRMVMCEPAIVHSIEDSSTRVVSFRKFFLKVAALW